MPIHRRSHPRPTFFTEVRGLARARHGRGNRSSVSGPLLPMLTGRVPRFERIVAETMDFLRMANPGRLDLVRVEIGNLPLELQHDDGIDRWHVEQPDRIVLYRVPIDRLAHLHCSDPHHYRVHVERCVVEAVAELLDVDPWDLAQDRIGFE